MKKKFISVFQVSFMVLVAISSFALCACSNDDDDNPDDGNGSSRVSVKYAATNVVNAYQVISADYIDYTASQIAPSNEICLSAVLKENENAVSWREFQFIATQYKETENGTIKDFTGIKNLKEGSHLVISSRKLFFFMGGSMSDEETYGASNPHGDVIVKSINGKNLILELKDFSFTNYNAKAETIINGTIEYSPN
ncbi:hypothetical protein [Bacteroides thetaiotaomicron]|uniref:hypothetical protein n=1 Tax=Bacteroides thetaiotaomicron TaxID=818 RepID=UPI0039C022FC